MAGPAAASERARTQAEVRIGTLDWCGQGDTLEDGSINPYIASVTFTFQIESTAGAARAGVFVTPHGPVETPAFMPVGTLAAVKTLDPDDLTQMGATMILANAYHLHLRPGDDTVREMGGLHTFMRWDRPIITDSGGFQVFSLAKLRTVSEDGVEFQSHIDGSKRFFTPESVMQIERNLGADVIMQFDHVIPGQSDETGARDASERSIRWLARCLAEVNRLDAGERSIRQALFPIVQGGIHGHLRREAAAAIAAMNDWPGFGIGGLSVGEEKEAMYAMLDIASEALPAGRPRYLM
ncbi:MAG: tRNA-guanine transglycosylase, partial [Gemmatimonadaceae bacterium]|nr:tRNA-guanine transglycosylase [Gemmatimonadaceae bacterium]